MKILVTDGNTRPALAICRSLGKQGHHLIVGDRNRSNLASVSKYCKERCIYPNPARQPESFIRFIIDYLEYNKIDILLPVTDITTIPLTENHELINRYCTLPFSSYQSIKRAADKLDILNMARALEVDIPASIVIHKPQDMDKESIDFSFPVVLKPARSRVMTDTGWHYTSVTYAESQSDLNKQLESLPAETYPVIVQERINGPGLGIFMCYQDGNPVAAFSHKRIREKPPSGGVSVFRESAPLDPLALEFSEKLLDELKWNGIAMVEFKIDERDNRPKLMEINGRFWGSLQLAIDAGIDFPAMLVKSITDTIPKNYDYRIGVKTRWLWGDIDALLLRLLKSNGTLQLPPNSPDKLRYLMDFMKLWVPGQHFEVLNLSDLRPWLFESYQWIKKAFN